MCIRDRSSAQRAGGACRLAFGTKGGLEVDAADVERDLDAERVEKTEDMVSGPVSYTHLDVYKRQEMGLVEATGALFASDFDPAAASANDSSVSKMLTFGETVATLVKHGVLNKELVDDLWWAPGAWAQVCLLYTSRCV